MSDVIQLAISGVTGRMGRALVETMPLFPQLSLVAALGRALQPRDASEALSGQDDWSNLQQAQVLVDFTRPEATMAYLEPCLKHRVAMMIGTTGFNPDQRETLFMAARTIPILLAPNTSLGANVLLQLVTAAAKALTNYDVEILEAHHRNKVDAPSGTALRIGEAIAEAKGWPWPEVADLHRASAAGARVAESIGFAVLRGGDVVGEHTAWFAGFGERIEITHRVTDRQTFAIGALRAASFLAKQPPGLYDMRHVLGFSR